MKQTRNQRHILALFSFFFLIHHSKRGIRNADRTKSHLYLQARDSDSATLLLTMITSDNGSMPSHDSQKGNLETANQAAVDHGTLDTDPLVHKTFIPVEAKASEAEKLSGKSGGETSTKQDLEAVKKGKSQELSHAADDFSFGDESDTHRPDRSEKETPTEQLAEESPRQHIGEQPSNAEEPVRLVGSSAIEDLVQIEKVAEDEMVSCVDLPSGNEGDVRKESTADGPMDNAKSDEAYSSSDLKHIAEPPLLTEEIICGEENHSVEVEKMNQPEENNQNEIDFFSTEKYVCDLSDSNMDIVDASMKEQSKDTHQDVNVAASQAHYGDLITRTDGGEFFASPSKRDQRKSDEVLMKNESTVEEARENASEDSSISNSESTGHTILSNTPQQSLEEGDGEEDDKETEYSDTQIPIPDILPADICIKYKEAKGHQRGAVEENIFTNANDGIDQPTLMRKAEIQSHQYNQEYASSQNEDDSDQEKEETTVNVTNESNDQPIIEAIDSQPFNFPELAILETDVTEQEAANEDNAGDEAATFLDLSAELPVDCDIEAGKPSQLSFDFSQRISQPRNQKKRKYSLNEASESFLVDSQSTYTAGSQRPKVMHESSAHNVPCITQEEVSDDFLLSNVDIHVDVSADISFNDFESEERVNSSANHESSYQEYTLEPEEGNFSHLPTNKLQLRDNKSKNMLKSGLVMSQEAGLSQSPSKDESSLIYLANVSMDVNQQSSVDNYVDFCHEIYIEIELSDDDMEDGFDVENRGGKIRQRIEVSNKKAAQKVPSKSLITENNGHHQNTFDGERPCVCSKAIRGAKLFLSCAGCQNVFHLECIKFTGKSGSIKSFSCPRCSFQQRHDSSLLLESELPYISVEIDEPIQDEDSDQEQVQTRTRSKRIQEQTTKKKLYEARRDPTSSSVQSLCTRQGCKNRALPVYDSLFCGIECFNQAGESAVEQSSPQRYTSSEDEFSHSDEEILEAYDASLHSNREHQPCYSGPCQEVTSSETKDVSKNQSSLSLFIQKSRQKTKQNLAVILGVENPNVDFIVRQVDDALNQLYPRRRHKEYTSQARFIMTHLKNPENECLRNDVRNGVISAFDLVRMTASDFFALDLKYSAENPASCQNDDQVAGEAEKPKNRTSLDDLKAEETALQKIQMEEMRWKIISEQRKIDRENMERIEKEKRRLEAAQMLSTNHASQSSVNPDDKKGHLASKVRPNFKVGKKNETNTQKPENTSLGHKTRNEPASVALAKEPPGMKPSPANSSGNTKLNASSSKSTRVNSETSLQQPNTAPLPKPSKELPSEVTSTKPSSVQRQAGDNKLATGEENVIWEGQLSDRDFCIEVTLSQFSGPPIIPIMLPEALVIRGRTDTTGLEDYIEKLQCSTTRNKAMLRMNPRSESDIGRLRQYLTNYAQRNSSIAFKSRYEAFDIYLLLPRSISKLPNKSLSSLQVCAVWKKDITL